LGLSNDRAGQGDRLSLLTTAAPWSLRRVPSSVSPGFQEGFVERAFSSKALIGFGWQRSPFQVRIPSLETPKQVRPPCEISPALVGQLLSWGIQAVAGRGFFPISPPTAGVSQALHGTRSCFTKLAAPITWRPEAALDSPGSLEVKRPRRSTCSPPRRALRAKRWRRVNRSRPKAQVEIHQLSDHLAANPLQ
jgi:hypothetical protein